MIYTRFLWLIAVIHVVVASSQHAHAQAESIEPVEVSSFPSQVSHSPGFPKKPLFERPGDKNASSVPNSRYTQSDSQRAGCPKVINQWATPSLSSKYTAGYAGGSTYLNSPHSRPRNHQEGTWGLDFTLWGQPKLAWLRWSDGSRRQSNGNFETDR